MAKSKPTSGVKTAAEKAKRDPLIAIGRQINDLYDENDRMDGEGNKAASRDIQMRIEILRMSLALHKATSVEGAIIQTAEAYTIVDADYNSKVPDFQRNMDLVRLRRLLYSVARFLDSDPALDMPALGVTRLMGEYLDPWSRRFGDGEGKAA